MTNKYPDGMISRPSTDELLAFRRFMYFLTDNDDWNPEFAQYPMKLSEVDASLFTAFQAGLAARDNTNATDDNDSPGILSLFRNHQGKLVPSVDGTPVNNVTSVTFTNAVGEVPTATITFSNVEIEPN